MLKKAIFYFFSVLIFSSSHVAWASSVEYDPLNTLLALNAAVVSVNSVVTTQDRIVLDQEYKTIINNLKLGEIEDDFEITNLYRQLMDSITYSALREEEASRFKERYDALQKTSLIRSMTGLRAYGGSLSSLLGSLLVSGVSAYFGYQDQKTEIRAQLDDSLWQLERDKIEDFNRLQKELLSASWGLLRKYNLPDEYRITQEDLQHYAKAILAENKPQAVRMFRRLERSFKMYPPFWYYYGAAAYASEQFDLALKCFDEFEKTWRPVLRRDPYLVAVIKHRIVMGGESMPKSRVLDSLQTLEENVGVDDWIDNLFIGVTAYNYGEIDLAIDVLEANINFGAEVDISGALLRAVEAGRLEVDSFSEELRGLLMMPASSTATKKEAEVKQVKEEIALLPSVPAPDKNAVFSAVQRLDASDEKELVRLFSRLPFGKSDMGIGRSIDEKKLRGAVESMNIRSSSEVIVLFDSTIWGGNADGIALTKTGIYSKRIGFDPSFNSWNQLVFSSVGIPDKTVHVGPFVLESIAADASKNMEIARALAAFRDYLRKKHADAFAKDQAYARQLVEHIVTSWVNGDDSASLAAAEQYLTQGRDNLLPFLICSRIMSKEARENTPFFFRGENMSFIVNNSRYFSRGFTGNVYQEIFASLEQAAASNPRASWLLGWLSSVLGKTDQSEKWFVKAVERDESLQRELGDMFAQGLYVSRDDVMALSWYRSALKRQDWEAKARIREMYAAGRGNASEKEKAAMEEYRREVAQGSVDALDEVGLMFLFGRGVDRSVSEAISWFRRAAERGYMSSQFNLGLVYAFAEDFPTDFEEAYKWFYLAAMSGHIGAKEQLDDLEGNGLFSREKLSPEAQSRARAVARSMFEEYKRKK